MTRTNRRAIRKEAMMNTILRINDAMGKVNFSDPNGKATFRKLLDKKDYIARQIGEANYTEHSMKSDQNEIQRIFADMDECSCSEWVKYEVERLAASRRRWSIATSKQIWLS